MTKLATMIGPSDHGRRMSLDDFDTAEAQEGRRYELSRGVIVVTDVPNPPHGPVLQRLRVALDIYYASNPGVIQYVFLGTDCKLLIEDTQSERHPDLAVYKTAMPGADSTIWSFWVPEIVVEVVSEESAHRDYVEKADDYLRFGVHEYWIIDPIKGSMTVHRRTKGRWQLRELKPGDTCATHLLPGFVLNVSHVLGA